MALIMVGDSAAMAPKEAQPIAERASPLTLHDSSFFNAPHQLTPAFCFQHQQRIVM